MTVGVHGADQGDAAGVQTVEVDALQRFFQGQAGTQADDFLFIILQIAGHQLIAAEGDAIQGAFFVKGGDDIALDKPVLLLQQLRIVEAVRYRVVQANRHNPFFFRGGDQPLYHWPRRAKLAGDLALILPGDVVHPRGADLLIQPDIIFFAHAFLP